MNPPDPKDFGILLGRGSYIGPYFITYGGKVHVGNYTSIAGNVTFLCGPSVRHASEVNPKSVTNYNFGKEYPAGDITIGSDVLIGTGAIIFGGVKIGDGAVVGAGSVVTRDVAAYGIAAGNPAKLLSSRYELEKRAALMEICWWNWKPEDIQAALPLMDDIEAFLREYGK